MARRHNGEGSIFPYRTGFGAYCWITTPEGRRQRKYVYGPTRAVVHEKWLALSRAAARGPVAPRVPKLEDFVTRWLAETVFPNLAPSTAANYEMFARLYIVPDLGRRKVDALTVREVQTWMNALRTRCQCCAQGKDARRTERRCCAAGRCCHQVASEWTRHQAWTVLQSALSAAMREELVSRNVAALVRVSTPRASRRPVWTVKESRQFLASAREADDPLYAAYVLMLTLGLRRGEVLGLGWSDVDLAGGSAVIGWQVQRVKGALVRRQTKTHSSDARLPLPDLCVRALEQRKRIEDSLRAVAPAWHETGLVLTSSLGTAIDPRNFQRFFRARASAAGVPQVALHSTRKACASLLVALDVHPRVAMAILRHSQIAVTMDVYAQVANASTTEALRRLSEQLDRRVDA